MAKGKDLTKSKTPQPKKTNAGGNKKAAKSDPPAKRKPFASKVDEEEENEMPQIADLKRNIFKGKTPPAKKPSTPQAAAGKNKKNNLPQAKSKLTTDTVIDSDDDDDDDSEEEVMGADLDSGDELQDPGDGADNDDSEDDSNDDSEDQDDDSDAELKIPAGDAEDDDSDEDSDDDTDSDNDVDTKTKTPNPIKKKKNGIADNKIASIKKEKNVEPGMTNIKNETDKKTLFVKNLPPDCKEADLRKLSKAIVDTRIRVALSGKRLFAYLVFKSEAEADKNYKLLQNKKLKGKEITVDYVGSKSELRPMSSGPNKVDFDTKRLFITGLGQFYKDEDLKKLFPKASEVIVIRRRNGNAMGYGFLTFTDEKMAKESLLKYENGLEVNGQIIVAAYAKPRRAIQQTQKGSDVKKGGPEIDKKKLYISGLGPQVKDTELMAVYPKATDVAIRRSKSDRPMFAFVSFASEEEAERMLKKSKDLTIGGQTVTVAYSNKSREPKKRKADAAVKEPVVKQIKTEEEEDDDDDDDDEDEDEKEAAMDDDDDDDDDESDESDE